MLPQFTIHKIFKMQPNKIFEFNDKTFLPIKLNIKCNVHSAQIVTYIVAQWIWNWFILNWKWNFGQMDPIKIKSKIFISQNKSKSQYKTQTKTYLHIVIKLSMCPMDNGQRQKPITDCWVYFYWENDLRLKARKCVYFLIWLSVFILINYTCFYPIQSFHPYFFAHIFRIRCRNILVILML